jgi:hypothetical protein
MLARLGDVIYSFGCIVRRSFSELVSLITGSAKADWLRSAVG